MIVRLVRCQGDSIFKPNGSKVKVGREHVAPHFEFAHGRHASARHVIGLRSFVVLILIARRHGTFGFEDLFHQMIVHEGLHELPHIVDSQINSRYFGLIHFVGDFFQRDAIAIVHSSNAVHKKGSQFGDEPVIEFHVRVPNSTRQFGGGCQLVQHKELFGLGRNGFDLLDESSRLERFENFVQGLILQIGFLLDIFGPHSHVARFFNDLIDHARRNVQALEFGGQVFGNEGIKQFLSSAMVALAHGQARIGQELIDDGSQSFVFLLSKTLFERRVGNAVNGKFGLAKECDKLGF
mmetsp:Transcript_15209/g.42067  ORF Transcript_15209/g.42067 Transcript_15209/m.42067 type:complete len:294 (-) Transcript_15209:223-1104(-)